jgi:hypothetical protein
MKLKIISAVVLSVILSVMIASAVLAGTGDINNFKAIPTDTTMSLKWSKSTASGYTSTWIEVSTVSQPLVPSDGTNIYSGTGSSYQQTGLTAGVTYYYTAWGYDGFGYTPNASAATILMTTLAGVVNTSTDIPVPNQPSPTAPSSANWFTTFQPFSGIVQNFEQSWGMATDTMQFSMGILILLFVGIFLYIKTKSSFIAIAGDFVVDFGLIALGLLSPFTAGVVIAFGLGIWGLENIWI